MHEPQFYISQGDAVDFLKTLPSGQANLVITDPPYESLEKHRAVGTTTRLKHSKSSSNDWFAIFPNVRFLELFAEIFRVLRRDSHFYLFCDVETMFIAKPIAESVGFKFWKPLIWDKKRIGMGYHYRARYECILFFEKGKRRLANLGIPDIIEASRVMKGYPTEKPVSVSEVLIKQSSQPSDLVVDPFAGSGSVGVAAVTHGRNFLGNDIKAESIEASCIRLVATKKVRSESVRLMLRSEVPMGHAGGALSTKAKLPLEAFKKDREVSSADPSNASPEARTDPPEQGPDAGKAQLDLLDSQK